jgi:hypothetical protein
MAGRNAGGPKTGGRKPGSKNVISTTAKENINAVFNRMGGYDAMTKWATDNQTEFYKIYARLIPTELNAKVEGNLVQALAALNGR